MFNSAYTSCENFFRNAYKKCKSAIDQIPVIGSLRRRRNAQGTNIKCNQMLHHKTQYKAILQQDLTQWINQFHIQ